MAAAPSFDQLLGSTGGRGDERKAALVLHSLCLSDREWLLSQMKDADRKRLHVLLQELEELNIPPQHDLLEEVTATEPAAANGSIGNGDAIVMSRGQRHQLEDLGDAELRSLASILASEPAQLVARLLRARPWPWAEAVLAQMGHSKRAVIEELMSASDRDATSGLAFDAQLLQLVERRLLEKRASATAHPVLTSDKSLVTHWKARLRHVLGVQAGPRGQAVKLGASRFSSDGVVS